MRLPRPRWPRRPRRSARLRLTLLYAAAFLACGAGVLAVEVYLLFGHATSPQPPLKSAGGQAVLSSRIPGSDVQREGRYDVLRLRVPSGLVHQDGQYYVVRTSIAVHGAKGPSLSAAQQARLLANAQFHINYDKEEILIISAVALAIIAAGAAAIGWAIAGRVLRPLSTITATARRIAASSLHERLALAGPDDELKELADTLDGLLARLEASFEAQRRFAANASHELRTPLTRERALLQVTLADPASTTGAWQAVSRELLASNAEQERLIEAMLTLASSETGPGEREPLDLAAVAREALAVPRPGTGRLGLAVHAEFEPAPLDGDPLLVQQLVVNLIDNAVQHNVPGGDVRVAATTSDGQAVLSVTNSGPVIPAAAVGRLFQPFQRLGPRAARRDAGHGLGLSIVRAIAAAHGAAIDARARPAGGLTVDVTFLPPGVDDPPREP